MGDPAKLITFAGFMLLWCGGQALDCSDPSSLQQEELRCFSQVGISVSPMNGEIQYVIQSDPAAVCREPEKYKQGLSCAFDVAKQCLQQSGAPLNLLPDKDRMAEGITYMSSQVVYDCLDETLGHCPAKPVPVVICNNVTSMMQGQLQCYEREGITIQLPQPDGDNTQSGLGTVEMLTRSYEAARDICREFMPDVSSMENIVDYVCEDLEGEYEGLFSPPFSAYKGVMDCLLDILPDCGCPTTRLYARAAKELSPAVCPSMNNRVPECNAVTGDSNSNTGTGGARSLQGPADLLAFFLVAAALFLA
ncbi:hypothetical protein BaRGS_00019627, partial [Batillaria attramentaria]